MGKMWKTLLGTLSYIPVCVLMLAVSLNSKWQVGYGLGIWGAQGCVSSRGSVAQVFSLFCDCAFAGSFCDLVLCCEGTALWSHGHINRCWLAEPVHAAQKNVVRYCCLIVVRVSSVFKETWIVFHLCSSCSTYRVFLTGQWSKEVAATNLYLHHIQLS